MAGGVRCVQVEGEGAGETGVAGEGRGMGVRSLSRRGGIDGMSTT